MHEGARLKKDPEARPKSTLNVYNPGSVFPKGSQIVKMAIAPSAMSPVWVLIRPYRSPTAPASNRPTVEALSGVSQW